MPNDVTRRGIHLRGSLRKQTDSLCDIFRAKRTPAQVCVRNTCVCVKAIANGFTHLKTFSSGRVKRTKQKDKVERVIKKAIGCI